MMPKNLPPNGRMPNLRTLESGRGDNSIDLGWLSPKIDEERAQDEHGHVTKPMEIVVDTVESEHVLTSNNHTFS